MVVHDVKRCSLPATPKNPFGQWHRLFKERSLSGEKEAGRGDRAGGFLSDTVARCPAPGWRLTSGVCRPAGISACQLTGPAWRGWSFAEPTRFAPAPHLPGCSVCAPDPEADCGEKNTGGPEGVNRNDRNDSRG